MVQALLITLGVFLALLLIYRLRLIRATANVRLGVLSATAGVVVVYLVSIFGGLVGVEVPHIHESGPIGIGFNLLVLVIAALNLVLDFDFIEHGHEIRAPKYMEWYGAFALVVTLLWIHLEALRLLSKVRD